MDRQILTGCCVASWIYNLGGAHGHTTAADQRIFDNRVRSNGYTSLNITVTNAGQSKTREFLRTQGWDEQTYGRFIIHTITAAKLRWYLKNAKYSEEKKPIPKTPKFAKKHQSITYDEVAEFIRRRIVIAFNRYIGLNNYLFVASRAQLSAELNEHYGINIPVDLRNSSGFYTADTLHRSIVSRVARRRKIGMFLNG